MNLKKTDYSYMFWSHGFRGKSPEGKRVMGVQSGIYGCAFDTRKADLLNYGSYAEATSAEEALVAENSAIYDLPDARLEWEISLGEKTYQLTGAFETGNKKEDLINLKLPMTLLEDGSPGEQTRMIVCGRYCQRFDMENLYFEDAEGNSLPVLGRCEVTVLPNFISIAMEISSEEEVEVSGLTARLHVQGADVILPNNSGAAINYENEKVTLSIPSGTINKAKNLELAFIIIPEKAEAANLIGAIDPVADIKAKGIVPYTDDLKTEYDDERGLYWITLSDINEHWDMENNRDIIERVKLSIANPSDKPISIPLVFSKPSHFSGVTGLTPMLRDLNGNPLGIPVQISKNWHYKQGEPILYDGPWFQGYTVLNIEPNTTFECDMTIAYALWGGVPAASHAQLCLIGYGGNQLWDQAAIGSFGESITYDPDVNLGRAMIDDVRPLMVTAMGGGKWTWTDNVGGGDFLVYFNGKNKKQYLTRMKTYYENYGPNLTNVHYAGVSADNKIEAHIKVSTPRCDDINRAYHYFRYDVKEEVEFSRLAFYQLGADGYNNHQFNKMAWGDKQGLGKEWEPGKGGLKYEMTGLPCEGEQVWFSLHDSIPGLQHGEEFFEAKGAWANRGMVIRSWSAKLGGKEVAIPYASVFLTEDNVSSSNVEISAPPELTKLQPGDYVECEVELLILPMCAEDYYGPNQGLKDSLTKVPNSWITVYRQAEGNDLQVSATSGKLLHCYPVVIEVDENDSAEFAIEGGISYTPIVITGLSTYNNTRLFELKDGDAVEIDQSHYGNDFWQTEFDPETQTWTRIYNVALNGNSGKKIFRIGKIPWAI